MPRLLRRALPPVVLDGLFGYCATKRERSMQLLSLTRAILLAAFISFLLSVSLWFAGYKDEGMFVGIWVPSILSLGALLEARR
jgi:hypothetical protein